jgi:hypothetical protein
MTPDREERIRAAATRQADAEMRMKYLAQMNVATDPEKRRLQNQEYALAQAELSDATVELNALTKGDYP